MNRTTRFSCAVFFFNDTATTEIYTLSLHDALPISALYLDPPLRRRRAGHGRGLRARPAAGLDRGHEQLPRRVQDRKSTRLNSSHANISYAVFCLKKKQTLLLPHSPYLHPISLNNPT